MSINDLLTLSISELNSIYGGGKKNKNTKDHEPNAIVILEEDNNVDENDNLEEDNNLDENVDENVDEIFCNNCDTVVEIELLGGSLLDDDNFEPVIDYENEILEGGTVLGFDDEEEILGGCLL